MTETVLGFDIRVCDREIVTAIWAGPRRVKYLLRPEIECPMSVDKAVLPSIFRYDFDEADNTAFGSIGVIGHGAHQRVLRLWAGFDAMKSAAAMAAGPSEVPSEAVAIGITVGDVPLQKLRNWQWREILEEPVDPRVLEREWEFLGFDIADDWLMSGLSNCLFEARRADEFAAKWAPRINEFGLLPRHEHAVEFKDILDRAVPEHAPFIVYGIHRHSEG